MKYAVFAFAALVGVPGMAIAGLNFAFVRELLMCLLVLSTAFGQVARINFVSFESYRGPDRGFEISAIDLINLVMLIILVVRYPKEIKWIPFNGFWLGLFFFQNLLSALNAPSLLYFGFSILKLSRVLLIYWCCANYFRVEKKIDGLWYGMVGAAFAVTAYAFVQKYMYGIYRVPGPFDHSNTIPPFLNLLLPGILLWTFCEDSFPIWKVNIGILAVLGIIFSVISTFSRAGLALSLACIAATVCFALFKKPSFRVSIFTLFLILGLVGGAIRAYSSFMERLKSAPKSSEEARDEFNEAANEMAHDYFLGVGLNNFSQVLTNVEKYRENIEVMANEEEAGVCHHIYWLTAAELGFSGLLVFGIILLRFGLHMVYHSFKSRKIPGLLLFAFLVGQCSLHLSGLLEWTFRQTPVMSLFFITCGVVVGISSRESEESDESEESV
ncbi:MAG: O-antigen ligase family protein [Candidatus Riflebacteria bacterium]|nr:O-antigen ligase family protein [Candidatus Riflebacteria bacterium]